MTTKAIWSAQAKMPKFPALGKDLKVDVAIVGGGIVGVTAAYLLKKAGRSVALLERDRFGSHDTGHTTAHLTYVTDARLHTLVDTFGHDHAQAAWDAGLAAMNQIQQIVATEGIDCDFAEVPGYLHLPWKGTNDADEIRALQKEAQLARKMGFEARFVNATPFIGRPGICFANQARFHPLKYLSGILRHLASEEAEVFEDSEVTEVGDKPLAVKANGHTVHCEYLIVATHVPLMGKAGLLSAALFQTKLTPYSSYAISAKVPKGTLPEALFWDTADPYYYVRVERQPHNDVIIFGGEDHKTGQEDDAKARFQKLEALLIKHVPHAVVTHQWSGQVIETHDGLPFIGETASRQFVATGFGGNGMTFGTLGAMMACDAARARKNPWQELFAVGRTKVLAGAWDYLKENADYPYYMVKDRLTKAEGTSLADLHEGKGMILSLDGQRVAAYRTEDNKVTTLSAACTHMGCIVHWNNAESTWDCPCHGSRFSPTGKVLAGPAEAPLEETKSVETK